MYFPLATASLAICLVWTYRRGGRRNALLLGLIAWAVELLLIGLPIFSYQVEYSMFADAFVGLALLLLTTGYFAVRSPTEPVAADRISMFEIGLAKAYGVLGIVGSVLLLYDASSRGTRISIRYLLENLATIRSSVFENLAYAVAPTRASVAGAYLGACGLLAIIASIRIGWRASPLLAVLAIANGVLTAAASLFAYGGRASVFYVVAIAFISAYLCGRRLVAWRLRYMLAVAATLLATWYFSVGWLQTREGPIDTKAVLADTQRATLRPWLEGVVGDDRAASTALLSLGYFASPLPTFTFYMARDPRPGPFWGAYSFPLPARIAARATGRHTADRWLVVRAQVFAPLESAGFAGNVWATWLRDLVVDFGALGALLVCSFFGAFLAWARNQAERSGEMHFHYLEVLAAFAIAVGAFHNVVWFTLIANAFFISLVTMLVVRARPRSRQVRATRGEVLIR